MKVERKGRTVCLIQNENVSREENLPLVFPLASELGVLAILEKIGPLRYSVNLWVSPFTFKIALSMSRAKGKAQTTLFGKIN